MTRWQVDDQPPDLAVSHCGEFCGNDLEVPVRHQLGLRVELLKAARCEGRQILPEQRVIFTPGQVVEHHVSPFAKRALSCSITFSSASLNAAVSGDTGSL